MGRSLREIYIHIVWGTKERRPFLRGDLDRYVLNELHELADDMNLHILAANSAWNHLHLLARWNSSIAFATAIKTWKAKTSLRWNKIAREDPDLEEIAWQSGAGIFSVSRQDLEKAQQYIHNQKRHHRDKTTIHQWERW